ncbi:glycosyltransferase, partial [Haloplanus salinarum]
RGLAVISTEFGTRGYNLDDGNHVFIATLENFGTALRRLSENPAKATAVARRGRQRVAERYTWESLSRQYISFLEEFID